MEVAGTFESAVPPSVIEVLERSLRDARELEEHLLRCLPMAEAELLSELRPVDRARVHLTLAKTATTLYTLMLRCNGIDPDEHPVKPEIERLKIYEAKLKKCRDEDNAPLRPSTTINYQAATRVIQHSLPDLTAEQKLQMREISKRKNSKSISSHKRQKCQTAEKPSVRVAAQEFLEKAMRELLGSNPERLKGPLKIDTSGDEYE